MASFATTKRPQTGRREALQPVKAPGVGAFAASSGSGLAALPSELWTTVFRCADACTLATIRGVCRTFSELVDPVLLRSLAQSRCPALAPVFEAELSVAAVGMVAKPAAPAASAPAGSWSESWSPCLSAMWLHRLREAEHLPYAVREGLLWGPSAHELRDAPAVAPVVDPRDVRNRRRRELSSEHGWWQVAGRRRGPYTIHYQGKPIAKFETSRVLNAVAVRPNLIAVADRVDVSLYWISTAGDSAWFVGRWQEPSLSGPVVVPRPVAPVASTDALASVPPAKKGAKEVLALAFSPAGDALFLRTADDGLHRLRLSEP